MSKENAAWLNRNVLVGMADQRGNAWHYRADLQTPIITASGKSYMGNHYPGAIPVADVEDRLFAWEAVSRRVAVEIPATVETMTHVDDEGNPLRWAVQDDRQAIATDDDHTVMGMFKAGYQAHQYSEWLVGNVATMLDDDLQISSAGLLSNRAVAWVEVSVPESITTPEGITFRPNLLATTSFDGTVATTYKRTVTATVCDNTLAMALSEKGQTWKAKHSRYSSHKITEARDALGIVYATADAFAAEVATLCQTPVTDKQFSLILDDLIPVKDKDGEPLSKIAVTKGEAKRERIAGMYRNDKRVGDWQGTAFGVYQAFNTWLHHEMPTRGKTNRAERNMLGVIKGDIDKFDALTLASIGKVLSNA